MNDGSDEQNIAIGNAIKTRKNNKIFFFCQKKQKNLVFSPFL
jgi:hypothetical protein